MKLQDVPKTAAEAASSVVKLPVELVTKAREAVEKQFGGGNGAEATKPAVEPTKVKAAKPKATSKKKKPAARKPAAKKPSAASAPTPTATVPDAERPEVIAEQTDGLDDAVDRAQFELHKRDVDVNTSEQR